MKFKRLIPALAMLLVSAILLGTSTFAWFSMNTQVSATGMQVKAAAEDGLLIHNELDADTAGNWLVTKAASYGNLSALAPTSTSDVTAWYHNKSNDPNNYAGVEAYETLSANANWKRETGASGSGVYFIDSTTNVGTKDASEKAYVLLNKFYIKSSGDEITLGAGNAYADLYINKVEVTGSTDSPDLDKALRVAIVLDGTTYIYAPFATANVTYTVNGTDSVTATAVPASGIVNTATTTSSIPAFTEVLADTLEADVYIYFEGEDQNCKSANVVENLDTLTVAVTFGITQLPTT